MVKLWLINCYYGYYGSSVCSNHKWGYPNSWMVYFMENTMKILILFSRAAKINQFVKRLAKLTGDKCSPAFLWYTLHIRKPHGIRHVAPTVTTLHRLNSCGVESLLEHRSSGHHLQTTNEIWIGKITWNDSNEPCLNLSRFPAMVWYHLSWSKRWRA